MNQLTNCSPYSSPYSSLDFTSDPTFSPHQFNGWGSPVNEQDSINGYFSPNTEMDHHFQDFSTHLQYPHSGYNFQSHEQPPPIVQYQDFSYPSPEYLQLDFRQERHFHPSTLSIVPNQRCTTGPSHILRHRLSPPRYISRFPRDNIHHMPPSSQSKPRSHVRPRWRRRMMTDCYPTPTKQSPIMCSPMYNFKDQHQNSGQQAKATIKSNQVQKPDNPKNQQASIINCIKSINTKVASKPIPNVGSKPIPNVGSKPIPNVGSKLIPNVGSKPIPNVGSKLIPNVGSKLIPNVGSKLIPNVGSKPFPNVEQHELKPTCDLASAAKVRKSFDVYFNSSEFKTKTRYTTLIESIILGNRCHFCGLRFLCSPEESKEYSDHLDMHFKRNRNLKQINNIGILLSRAWYLSANEWSTNVEAKEFVRFSGSMWKCMTQTGIKQTSSIIMNRDREDIKKIKSKCSVPAFEKNRDCPLCEEVFETYFDEDFEEWRFRNSALADDGRAFHVVCLHEYKEAKNKH